MSDGVVGRLAELLKEHVETLEYLGYQVGPHTAAARALLEELGYITEPRVRRAGVGELTWVR